MVKYRIKPRDVLAMKLTYPLTMQVADSEAEPRRFLEGAVGDYLVLDDLGRFQIYPAVWFEENYEMGSNGPTVSLHPHTNPVSGGTCRAMPPQPKTGPDAHPFGREGYYNEPG